VQTRILGEQREIATEIQGTRTVEDS